MKFSLYWKFHSINIYLFSKLPTYLKSLIGLYSKHWRKRNLLHKTLTWAFTVHVGEFFQEIMEFNVKRSHLRYGPNNLIRKKNNQESINHFSHCTFFLWFVRNFSSNGRVSSVHGLGPCVPIANSIRIDLSNWLQLPRQAKQVHCCKKTSVY